MTARVFDLEPLDDRASIVPIVELTTAVLCLDCEAIYGATATTCPRCQSVHRFPVARVIAPLNPQFAEPAEELYDFAVARNGEESEDVGLGGVEDEGAA